MRKASEVRGLEKYLHLFEGHGTPSSSDSCPEHGGPNPFRTNSPQSLP
jgi:hypothetical protein